MNKETVIKGIDEIPVFSFNTKTKEFCVLGHKFEGVNSVEDFITYITNLEKEKKHLEDQLDNALKMYDEKLKKNSKAIEYIQKHIRIDDEYPSYMEMLIEEKEELLDILQGNDKE